MKQRDKLAEYIRNEVDSIPYEEEDQMWEEFQKENSEQLAKWNKSNYFFWLLIPFLLLIMSGIIFLEYNNDSATTANNNTHSTIDNNTITSTKKLTESVEINTVIIDENENTAITTTANEETNTFSENKATIGERDLFFNKSVQKKAGKSRADKSISLTHRTANVGNKNNIGNSIESQSVIFDNNEITSSIVESNVNNSSSIFLESKTNQEKPLLEIAKEGDELSAQISSLAFLSSDASLLELADFKNRLNTIDKCPPYRKRIFFARALFSSSANGIYKTALDFGSTKKLSRTTGLNYGIGLSFEEGFSVSQDSFFIINGITIEEIRKSKDLDYLINSFVNAEYFFKMNDFKVSFGGQLSYATINRIVTLEETSSISIYPTGGSNGVSHGYEINLWTNGINRFGINTMINLSYRIKNYEVSVLASKRLNKLIKNNNAQRNKINNPIQIGTSITRYF